jgi:hypothetical protein
MEAATPHQAPLGRGAGGWLAHQGNAAPLRQSDGRLAAAPPHPTSREPALKLTKGLY